MIKRMIILAAAATLPVGTHASAAVISSDTGASGRYQSSFTNDGDYSFGNPFTSTGRVVGGGVPRVGRSGGANEFLGLFGYQVTADFAADINAGGTASIQIGTGGAGGGGAPASIDLLLLQITGPGVALDAGMIETDVIEPTPTGGLIATLTSPAVNSQFNFDITTQLTVALAGGTLAVGDYIWIGADAPIGATVSQNIELGTGPADLLVDTDLETTLTSVPEPGSLALAGVGLGALLGRRRRA